MLDHSDHSSMAEQEFNKGDDEKRARGGKRTSETKFAEVSTSKSKKRAKKAPAVVQSRLGDSENLRLDRQDRGSRWPES